MRGGTILPRKDRQRRSSAAMIKDPYTIVVALDSSASAYGTLYIDDGHSYNYKKGDYLWREFQFKNNKLSYKKLRNSQPSQEEWTKTSVERLIIAGLKKSPKKVILTEKGSHKELTFTYIKEENKLIVKKPDCGIANDWEIKLSY